VDLIWGFFGSVFANMVTRIKVKGSKKEELNVKTIESLKGSLCDFQGAVLSHVVELYAEHKELRISVSEYEREENSKAFENIKKSYDAIKVIHESHMDDAFGSFTSSLEKVFIHKKPGKMPPRIGLKRVAHNHNDGCDYVTDFAPRNNNTQRDPSKITDNSVMESLFKLGEVTLCNNIPKSVDRGLFKCSRLNRDEVHKYRRSKATNWMSKLAHNNCDNRWRSCWYDGMDKKDVSAYYKSTLIVPVTLRKSRLSTAAKLSLTLNKLTNYDSITIGALCFDHVNINYFDNIDTDLGFIVADALSIFMFTSRNCMEDSETYSKALEILSKKHPTP